FFRPWTICARLAAKCSPWVSICARLRSIYPWSSTSRPSNSITTATLRAEKAFSMSPLARWSAVRITRPTFIQSYRDERGRARPQLARCGRAAPNESARMVANSMTERDPLAQIRSQTAAVIPAYQDEKHIGDIVRRTRERLHYVLV